MNQLNLFEKTGQQLKDEGMKLAADNRPDALSVARQIAEELRNPDGITADDVSMEYEKRGIGDWHNDLGNAAGSLFKCGGWTTSNEFRKSTRPASHARLLRVWK